MSLQSTQHILQTGLCALKFDSSDKAGPPQIANKAKQEETRSGSHGRESGASQVPRAVLAQGTVTRTRGAALRRQTALGPCCRGAVERSAAGGQPSCRALALLGAKRRQAGERGTGWLPVGWLPAGTQPLEPTSLLVSSSSENAGSLEKGTIVFLEVNIWGLVVCPPQWAGSSLVLPRPEKP